MQNYLPNIENINELQSASSISDISDSAIDVIDQISAAQSINSNANTGEHQVLWQRPLSENLKTALTDAGYSVEELDHVAIPGRLSVISWKD